VSLSSRLRQRRLERGLTAAELARAASVSRNYLSVLERGLATNPSAPILQRLADALGTGVDDLLDQAPLPDDVDVPEALKRLALIEGLTAEDVRMLAAIRWRGRRPLSLADWHFLLEAIRRAVTPE